MTRSSLSLVTAPAAEPVAAADIGTLLGISITADISDLIEGARQAAEAAVKRAFITQTWDLRLDAFPASGELELPKPPLQSVTHVKYYDTTGTLQTLASTEYSVDAPAGPTAQHGRVILGYGKSWPSTHAVPNAVTVRFVAGYGAAGDAVPGGLRTLVRQLVGDLYGDPSVGDVVRRRVGPTEVEYLQNRAAWPEKLLRLVATFEAFSPATFGAAF